MALTKAHARVTAAWMIAKPCRTPGQVSVNVPGASAQRTLRLFTLAPRHVPCEIVLVRAPLQNFAGHVEGVVSGTDVPGAARIMADADDAPEVALGDARRGFPTRCPMGSRRTHRRRWPPVVIPTPAAGGSPIRPVVLSQGGPTASG